ncbi:MAG: hypothetical protein FD138_3409 [Planctomycetota bacterium]|nr:MAG: hypothetical protein FD138_3409 [Planctomycetota bacterium]
MILKHFFAKTETIRHLHVLAIVERLTALWLSFRFGWPASAEGDGHRAELDQRQQRDDDHHDRDVRVVKVLATDEQRCRDISRSSSEAKHLACLARGAAEDVSRAERDTHKQHAGRNRARAEELQQALPVHGRYEHEHDDQSDVA